MTNITNFSKLQAGDIVLVPFPFSDLSSQKVRPGLVIRNQIDEDILLVPISTKTNKRKCTIALKDKDYTGELLPVESIVRHSKLFTIHNSLVLKKYTKLNSEVLEL